MLRIGSIAGLTLTTATLLWVGVVQAEVVVDMPPPPTTEPVTVKGDDAATSGAPTTRPATKPTTKPTTKPAAVPGATPPGTALARFGDRQQAQDSAGNPRGVNIPSTFSNGSMAWGGMGWGYDGFDDGWGYSGYWGISPWLLMSGWGGGCCWPYGWSSGCSPYGGGYGFGWSGSSISIGGGSASLRIGNVGLIR